MQDVEFTDRTDVLRHPPSSLTRCGAGCEGFGVRFMGFGDWLALGYTPDGRTRPSVIPQQTQDGRWEPFPPERSGAKGGSHDPTLLVECSGCHGTGRRRVFSLPFLTRVALGLDFAHTFYYQAWFPLWAIGQEAGEFRGLGWRAVRNLPFWVRFIHHDQKRVRASITSGRLRGR